MNSKWMLTIAGALMAVVLWVTPSSARGASVATPLGVSSSPAYVWNVRQADDFSGDWHHLRRYVPENYRSYDNEQPYYEAGPQYDYNENEPYYDYGQQGYYDEDEYYDNRYDESQVSGWF